jgi:tetratricopeptide (TPR) repeat protein
LYNQGLAYYAAGKMEEAIQTWNKAVQIDGRFDPAIEGIKAAENSLRLYDRFRDLQNLD